MDYRSTITSILDNHGIEYWEEGNNVSPDTVNVQCPFCDDHSNHCGIFVENMVYHCWRCDGKGWFGYLLSTLTGRSLQVCNEEIEAAGYTFTKTPLEEIQSVFRGSVKPRKEENKFQGLPEYFEAITSNTNFPLLDWYLNLRKVEKATVIDHNCGICRVGPFMNRMIIPVFERGQVVSYQAADLTRKSPWKYKNAFAKMDFLYNIDRIQKKGLLIITEGVLDCWRVGPHCVCSFGTHLTDRQKSLIIEKEPEYLIGLWDNDAYWKMVEQMEYFDPFVENVVTRLLPEGQDPDSMGRDFGRDKLWELILEDL